MNLINRPDLMRESLRSLRHNHKIALVPTMGNLHAGHLQLAQAAQNLADIVVVSIFVNPLQFGPNEDFATYPRTLEQDLEKLSEIGIEWVFAPSTEQMYPQVEHYTQVSVPKISEEYCGYFRPLFFYGVTTVVTKLFNIVQPDLAIFGEKDFQQLHIIKKMVADLSFPIEIISLATIREQDGLAMSSRNQYLSPEERTCAGKIYSTLCELRDALIQGDSRREDLILNATRYLQTQNFKVDYLHICNRNTLEIASESDSELVILVAAWLNNTRLIDNLSFSLSGMIHA